MKTWWLPGCLALASCTTFGVAPSGDSDSASTSPPKNTSTTTTTTTTSPAPSSTTSSPTFQPNQPNATPLAANLWPFDRTTEVDIPICFESTVSATDREHFKDAEDIWSDGSPLVFTGNDDCSDGTTVAVRVTTTTTGLSHVEAMGVESLDTHLFLLTGQSTDDFESDALHELGHIIGLGHEDLSDPTDRANCDASIASHGITDDLPGEPPAGRGIDDVSSIMSRCRTSNAPQVTLADTDAVLTLYLASQADPGDDDDFDP